jgi:hypothetical protein
MLVQHEKFPDIMEHALYEILLKLLRKIYTWFPVSPWQMTLVCFPINN